MHEHARLVLSSPCALICVCSVTLMGVSVKACRGVLSAEKNVPTSSNGIEVFNVHASNNQLDLSSRRFLGPKDALPRRPAFGNNISKY